MLLKMFDVHSQATCVGKFCVRRRVVAGGHDGERTVQRGRNTDSTYRPDSSDAPTLLSRAFD